MLTINRQKVLYSVLLIVACVLGLGCGRGSGPSPSPDTDVESTAQTSAVDAQMAALFESGDLATHRLVEKNGRFEMLVEEGDEDEAIAYYKKIAAELGTGLPTLRDTDLGYLLKFCGFDGVLSPNDLEDKTSAQLMALSSVPDEILATRFFAPKIVDVSSVPATRYGWRKLVRLKVKGDSGAAKAGVESAFLLFNYLSEEPAFPGGKAGQIQAILLRGKGTGDPVYFLVYQAFPSYKVGDFLVASFDAATKPADTKYYVPRACAQCHGAALDQGLKEAKVNYLDTDHWFDRAGDPDFPKLPKAAVLPDGSEGFDVFRKLNREIQAQTERVDKDKTSFQLRAVKTWLKLHEKSGDHAPLFDRSLLLAEGQPDPNGWKPSVEPDQTLLPLLNRHCFRCHSSFKYHVFDRKAVAAKKTVIPFLLDDNGEEGGMPQDRLLSEIPPPPENLKEMLKALVAKL